MADPWRPEPGPAQFARLKPEQQDAILGRGAGAAYRAGAFRLEDVVGRSFSPDWGSMRRAKSLREMVGAEETKKWAQFVRLAAASKPESAELTFRSIAEAEKWARKAIAERVGFSRATDAQSVKIVCQVARELQEQCGLQKLDSLRFSAAKKLVDNGQCRFVTEAGRVYSSGDVVIGRQSDTTRGLARLQEGRRVAEEIIAQHGRTAFRDDILLRYTEQIKAVYEGRFDTYGVHSKYAFRDPYEATARHELAHAWHGQHADVIKSKLGFGYGESVSIEVLRRYGVTVRALDSWNECIAENFVLYSAGKTDRIHPDLLSLFKGLTV